MKGIKLRDYQQEASNAAVAFFRSPERGNGLIVAPTGCHAKGSKVLLYCGDMRKVENIKVGDMLMGDDGTPRTVTGIHHGFDEMIEVNPNKGDKFIVNKGHILHLYKTCEGHRYPSSEARYDEISVADYLRASKTYKHVHKLHRAAGVYFPQQPCVFEPYIVGLFLGDGGCTRQPNITTQRKEIVEYLKKITSKHGLGLTVHNKKQGRNKAKTYTFPCSGSNRVSPNPLTAKLKEIGLYGHAAGDKFIPFAYKVASEAERYELLAGLLDTDAYYNKLSNAYEYCTKSPQLADDIVFVCRSLGLYAIRGKSKFVNTVPYYRIHISGDFSKLPAKVAIRKGAAYRNRKNNLVTAFKIRSVGWGEYYGFTVDGNHLYCDDQFFVHHNSGKSVVIADVARQLNANVLVLQPSKEILLQNFAKLKLYGIEGGIYSASVGKKDIKPITFATIGSIMNHISDFDHFGAVIMDEAHLANAVKGQYKAFFEKIPRKVLGLTATPYRLYQMNGIEVGGRFLLNGTYNKKDYFSSPYTTKPGIRKASRCMSKFLTRTKPRIFTRLLYNIPIQKLIKDGYLSQPEYYSVNAFDEARIARNSTGLDFDDQSLREEFERVNFTEAISSIVRRLQHPKRGGKRRGILVFTRFVDDAKGIAAEVPNSAIISGDTPAKERDAILAAFQCGEIEVLTNAAVLTTGYDYPALDTVVIARPTMSLSLYTQMVGRVLRVAKRKKTPWVVDLGNNLSRFGRLEDTYIQEPSKGLYQVTGWVRGVWRPLTNVLY